MLHRVCGGSFLTAEITTARRSFKDRVDALGRVRKSRHASEQSVLFWSPTGTFSLRIPEMSERGVCLQLLTAPRIRKEKCGIDLQARVDTLNFGTGRSVSLYLVHRRPILGSRTMSTGGIPGFCGRRGGRHTHTQCRYPFTAPHATNLLQSCPASVNQHEHLRAPCSRC